MEKNKNTKLVSITMIKSIYLFIAILLVLPMVSSGEQLIIIVAGDEELSVMPTGDEQNYFLGIDNPSQSSGTAGIILSKSIIDKILSDRSNLIIILGLCLVVILLIFFFIFILVKRRKNQ